MRAIVLTFLLKILVPQAGQELQVLQGRVLHQGSDAPLPGARVVLARLNPNLPATTQALMGAQNVAIVMTQPLATSPGYVEGFLGPTADLVGVTPEVLRPLGLSSAVTDDAGRFSFRDLLPGRYALNVEREGYFGPRYGENSGSTLMKVITIETAKRSAELDIHMMRGGVISGRVRDPQGQPASQVRVVAYEASFPLGRARLNGGTSATTDDRGDFRLFWLAPGQYVIGTAPSVGSRGGGVIPVTWAHTYYPGVINPAEAMPFDVKDSSDITAADIDMRNESRPMFKISGSATNASPRRINPRIFVVPNEEALIDTSMTTPVGPTGEFEIPNVRSGTYDLIVSDSRTTVTVRDADVRGVSMAYGSGPALALEIVAEASAAPTINLNSLKLRLRPMDSTPQTVTILPFTNIQFDAAGKLTLENLPPSRYSIMVTGPLPVGAYIADVRQAGRSVYNDGISVGQQADPVTIVIATAGARVNGLVEGADRKPVANATVILVPPEARRRNPLAFKTAITGDDGRFSMIGVAPGGYTLFALPTKPYGEPWMNAGFLAKYLDRARLINVAGQSTSETQLQLIAD